MEGRGEAVAPKLSMSLPEGVDMPWSTHSFFTDERLLTFLVSWVVVQMISGGFNSIYGWCGAWYHMDHEFCGEYGL